jgi:hypothetical protein
VLPPFQVGDCGRSRRAVTSLRAASLAGGNVGDNEIRALLDCYRCPVPFHAVRTRLLGNITPVDSRSTR